MTGIVKKVIDDTTAPDAEVRRDGTTETDWFPIFRSGKYPQGKYSRDDIDQIVEEFRMSGRRPPMVFDHLTKEDFGENAKPGRAAGFLIDFRAVDSTDSRYSGARVLETRAKASWMAQYATREGDYRNLSVGLYSCAGQDGKKRLAVHHLALLGAAPPQIQGLPEVLFSERVGASDPEEILSFSVDDSFALVKPSSSNPSHEERVMKDPINFSEHEARLGEQKASLELAHSQEISSFKEEIATFKAVAETATAKAESAKAELETVKASLPVVEETAKQAGIAEGIEQGKAQAERLFSEKNTQRELEVFAEALRKEGKITEQEFKGDDKKPALSARLFAMPEAVRQDFKDLLLARVGVVVPAGNPSVDNFRGEAPGASDAEAALAKEAQALVRDGKFANFRDAWSHVNSAAASAKQEG